MLQKSGTNFVVILIRMHHLSVVLSCLKLLPFMRYCPWLIYALLFCCKTLYKKYFQHLPRLFHCNIWSNLKMFFHKICCKTFYPLNLGKTFYKNKQWLSFHLLSGLLELQVPAIRWAELVTGPPVLVAEPPILVVYVWRILHVKPNT